MGLTPDIMQHITGVSADSVQTLDYDFLSGNLIINAADFQANGGTLDRVYKASKAYIEGSHNTYSDLSTTIDENHPYIAVINGEIYFFNPNESSEELNDAVRDLAATGAASIKEVASTDNYIFEKDGKYYSYSPVLLPKSVWYNTSADADSYNYYEPNGTTNSYYNVVLRTDRMNAIDTTTWTESDKATADTYSWANTNIPLASNIKPVEDAGNLVSASGMIRFNLPYKDAETETRYYEYTYTVPDDYTREPSRIDMAVLGNYITNKYFYNINTSGENGGAIYNDTNPDTPYNINADLYRQWFVTEAETVLFYLPDYVGH